MIVLNLKIKLRTQYRRYMKKLNEYPCGADLAENISPALVKMKNELQETYLKLRELDRECPAIDWLERL